jgi:hypothetical protein
MWTGMDMLMNDEKAEALITVDARMSGPYARWQQVANSVRGGEHA